MRLMFAVFLLSFFALAWAAVAIARHIWRQGQEGSRPVAEASVAPAQDAAGGEPAGAKIEAAGRR